MKVGIFLFYKNEIQTRGILYMILYTMLGI